MAELMPVHGIVIDQGQAIDTPGPTIEDPAILDAVAACQRAVAYTQKLAAAMGGAHQFAYAILPASDRGRPCLAIVTGAGEACMLTKQVLAGMMTDHLQTAAWYGPLPVILRVDVESSHNDGAPLSAIHVCALPISACSDRRYMVKLRGLHRAADGKLLVLTRPSPWKCLPNARVLPDSLALEDV